MPFGCEGSIPPGLANRALLLQQISNAFRQRVYALNGVRKTSGSLLMPFPRRQSCRGKGVPYRLLHNPVCNAFRQRTRCRLTFFKVLNQSLVMFPNSLGPEN